MDERIIYWIIFGLLLIHLFFFAPALDKESVEYIELLTVNPWEAEPLAFAIFNLMGVWPVLYACTLYLDRQEEQGNTWIHLAASFLIGAFSILPYLGYRKTKKKKNYKQNILTQVLDSKILAWALLIIAGGLLAYGLASGSFQAYTKLFAQNTFINVMSLDFLALAIVYPLTIREDAKRRNQEFQYLYAVPLIGGLYYLVDRNQLPVE